ncbi:hypothetical protein F2Q69_00008965, partial [Brassica cretica]
CFSSYKLFPLATKKSVAISLISCSEQRNNLIHNQTSIPPASAFYGIDKEERNIISGRRLRKPFRSLMMLWLRSFPSRRCIVNGPSCFYLFLPRLPKN